MREIIQTNWSPDRFEIAKGGRWQAAFSSLGDAELFVRAKELAAAWRLAGKRYRNMSEGELISEFMKKIAEVKPDVALGE